MARLAREAISGLSPSLQNAVENALLRVQFDPWIAGKPLRGRMHGMWVARVGSYRILYTIEGSESSVTVVVRDVLHRSVAYRR